MFIIGECINGMFKDVADAIEAKDKSVIQDLTKKQIACGANALDVNVGPQSSSPEAVMEWLVEAIIEVSDVSLSIDTTKLSVMEAGLAKCKSVPIINSTSGDKDKLVPILSLATKYNARVIGLTMDKSGIPQNAEARIEIAMHIVSAVIEAGLRIEDLFIDAVILPVNVAQVHAKEVLETIRQCQLLSEPPPHTILGLSNVSQGTEDRSLINCAFLSMAISCGLDAAILNPLDKALMDGMITAELLLGKSLYCDSYLQAYRRN